MNYKDNSANAAVKIDSNVTIRMMEGNKLIRTSKIHNKATMHMVTGLLEFLSGSFNAVKTNPMGGTTTPEEITSYIPVNLHLGTVGIKMSDRSGDKPVLTGINRSEFKTPTFDDYKLQNDITPYYTKITGLDIKFDTVNITNFDDPNNSMGLLLQVKLPAGQLVGVGETGQREYFIDNYSGGDIPSGVGWVYYNNHNGRYETMFTELGLFSNTGNLLARVLLDGETTVTDDGEIIFDNDEIDTNPIIQSDITSLVIEWRIGIISLGQNDYVISESKTVPQLESISERNILRGYIEGSNKTIVVPDGTRFIRSNCFKDMADAVSIILPKSLGQNYEGEFVIESDAFSGCESLHDIYYKGSEEEWTNVTIDNESGGNNQLYTATKHYNYAEDQEV